MCFLALLLLAVPAAAQLRVPSDWQAAMNRIRAGSVRGHVSFLASDLLEGRGTPSRGLDIAAEYIVSNFRRAGLEPLPNGTYFHTLELRTAAVDTDGFVCMIHGAGGETRLSGVPFSKDGIDVTREPLLPLTSAASPATDAVTVYRGEGAGLKELMNNGARLNIVVDPSGRMARSMTTVRASSGEPRVAAGRFLFVPSFPEDLPADARVTVKAKPLAIVPLSSRNVAGIFRGSDPVLRDSYLVVSAHYDHVGRTPFGSGDGIFNGANDDASGVTALLEMAEAFSHLPERPKRSVLFVAFAAEELGLLGSKEFARNPPVPAGKIVANLNFEHLGRPDADNSSYLRKATITGFGYTSMSATLAAAGRLSNFEFMKHEQYNDQFYSASDNLPFAQKGIPSHTISNGFLFPEYHAPGDHWEKLDCDNLAALARALALGVLTIADDARAPQWNEGNEKTEAFRKAAKELAQ